MQIIVWLGITAGLTLMAMGVWTVVWHGSQSTESLKWLQFLQTAGTFLLPPVLCAWMWDAEHKPLVWLRLDHLSSWRVCALAVVIMLCSVPAINLLADLNRRLLDGVLSLGHWSGIVEWMKAMEDAAASLTDRFLQADDIPTLLINIGLMALLPALAEEFSFRGTLQQIIEGAEGRARTGLAIWVTAIIFAAIHMQFYGFIPRMLMGAMFGYVFVWTRSLWVPVLMHFTNNALAVVIYYILSPLPEEEASWANDIADTIGAGDTWYVGLISLLIVGLGLYIITYLGPREYARRTRKE